MAEVKRGKYSRRRGGAACQSGRGRRTRWRRQSESQAKPPAPPRPVECLHWWSRRFRLLAACGCPARNNSTMTVSNSATGRSAMLDVRGLTKKYRNRAVVDHVTFTVPPGQVTDRKSVV